MKYNPRVNELVARLEGIAEAHPYQPESLSQGCLEIMKMLQRLPDRDYRDGCDYAAAGGGCAWRVYGHPAGAGVPREQGQCAEEGSDSRLGAWDESCDGGGGADIRLQNLKSNAQGMVDIAELERMVDEDTAALMLTNPSTIGVFESEIHKIADILHAKGALLYMDGANMNALVGKTRPGDFGVDVMHLNLHKTFSTPHGGGGPGSGPVACKKILEPFLPTPVVVTRPDGSLALEYNRPQSVGRVRMFYGNFGMFVRALAYILANGPDGLRQTTEDAVLNANYIRAKLEGTFDLPYKTRSLHEVVFSDKLQAKNGVKTGDMGKRLIDYGFHAYTVSFPMVVQGAMMIEPTESESREELDLLVDALKQIAREAEENPELVQTAPHSTRIQRLDETTAARKPILRWKAPIASTPLAVDTAAKEW